MGRSRSGYLNRTLVVAIAAATALQFAAPSIALAGSGAGSYSGLSTHVESGSDAAVSKASRVAREEILTKLKERASAKKPE